MTYEMSAGEVNGKDDSIGLQGAQLCEAVRQEVSAELKNFSEQMLARQLSVIRTELQFFTERLNNHMQATQTAAPLPLLPIHPCKPSALHPAETNSGSQQSPSDFVPEPRRAGSKEVPNFEDRLAPIKPQDTQPEARKGSDLICDSRPVVEDNVRPDGPDGSNENKSREKKQGKLQKMKTKAEGAMDLVNTMGWLKPPKRNFISGVAAMTAKSEMGCFSKFVRSGKFDGIAALLILSNAVTIGVNTQWNASNPFDTPPPTLSIVESLFCWLFTAELLARMIGLGMEFLLTTEWCWNLFDVIVVATAIADECVKLTAGGSGSSDMNYSFMRVLRILRIARIMRVVRLFRFFKELRVMLVSIMSSLKALFWTILLLVMLLYVLAVYITQTVTDHVRDYPEQLDSPVRKYYGSVWRSLLSLYQAMSGGMDWAELADPLIDDVSIIFAPAYSVYIAFVVFAVLNVVTGIFVEKAVASAANDRDHVIQEELAKQDSYVNEVRDMFREADTDGSGMMSWEEFEEHMQDARVQAYFKVLELDVSEAHGLFKLLDMDNGGYISCDEFVMGCLRLKGQAKNVDVATLIYENKRMALKWSTFSSYVEDQFKDLFGMLDATLNKQLPVTTDPHPAGPHPAAHTGSSGLGASSPELADIVPGIPSHGDDVKENLV